MKNLFLAFGVAGILAATSCGTVQRGAQAQANRSEFLKLKGTWQLVSADYDQSYLIKPFDENADVSCWIGSQWNLVPNNWTGSYTLNGGNNCPSVTQPIKFMVANGSDFSFKKIADGTKAKQNTAGYALTLVNQTADTFSVAQNVPFESENVRVVYTFQKVSN